MASVAYYHIGFRLPEKYHPLFIQLLISLGVSGCVDQETMAGLILDDFNPYFNVEAREFPLPPFRAFLLFNLLFPGTIVYEAEESSSNTSDAYYREETIYDPTHLTVQTGTKDYCYGEGTANGRYYTGTRPLDEVGTKVSKPEPITLPSPLFQEAELTQIAAQIKENDFTELAALWAEKTAPESLNAYKAYLIEHIPPAPVSRSRSKG